MTQNLRANKRLLKQKMVYDWIKHHSKVDTQQMSTPAQAMSELQIAE